NPQVCLVNVARHLGEAALLNGDLGAALPHLERALAWADQIGHRPEVALTRLDLAELLLQGAPDQQAEALAHLGFGIEESRSMKMQPWLEGALRHKGLLHA